MSWLNGKQGNSSTHFQRVVVLLLVTIVAVTLACNGGYKIKLKKLQNCAGPNAVITANENYTVVLTKNCEIKARGCGNIKAFKTAVAKITVKKSGMQMFQGTINICEKLAAASSNSTIGPILRTFNIPEKCPVEAGTLCVEPTQGMSIEPYKQFLSLARGSIDVETEIQHDTGKSCFKVQVDITK
ncbi:uncharacterized protein LOC129778544 [Toxorhynchites rutilus septentrionalis]|uniref:uncharacterized protein LOC129778544 n=1 Tax=Toxorhynchites rutilus septentrionalis TaxID=329112 RepID=UPI00247AE698|nr:uncharacterized protein LOC129778544 [Toxorhynchites rutilus septentrionalis]